MMSVRVMMPRRVPSSVILNRLAAISDAVGGTPNVARRAAERPAR
jgi:hypothetical protein